MLSLGLMLTPPATAQPLREGWIYKERSEKPTWVYGENEGVVTVFTSGPNEAAGAKVVLQQLDLPALCPGMSRAAFIPTANGNAKIAKLIGGPVECGVAIRMIGQATLVLVAIQKKGSAADAINFAASIAERNYGEHASVATPTNRVPPLKSATAQPLPSANGGGDDEALRAVVARIPAANRPIDIVLISEWDSVSSSMAYKPRIVFANGYAVDECDGWDMSTIAPTPASLKAIGSDCSVERWKKVGGKYFFQDDDGDWSEPGTPGQIKGFRAGQRINIDYSYVGGGGQTAFLPGASSSSHLNSGALKMSNAGYVGIADWFSNTIYTRNVQTTGTGEKAVEGRYFLNGYIIAIKGKDGSISFGTIGQKQEDKLYIYLNGELYWQR
jgi:hypothetical protein